MFLFEDLRAVPKDAATRELLGGKSLKCWEMAQNQFAVPDAGVLSTLAYDQFVEQVPGLREDMVQALHGTTEELSVAILKRNSTMKKMLSTYGREVVRRKSSVARKPALEDEIRGDSVASAMINSIQRRLLKNQLVPELVDKITAFVQRFPSGTAFAVRSSGTYEDMASASFAGQYSTFLNQRCAQDVVASVIKCWASMWQEHVLEYRRNLALRKDDEGSSSGDLSKLAMPAMSVLIMRQIDSQVAGVMFTRNPATGDVDQIMIESVWGQGEGLVSAELVPDRYVFSRVSKQQLSAEISSTKTHMYELAKDKTGTCKVVVPEKRMISEPTLDEDRLAQLLEAGTRLHEFHGSPQDVEWAFDESGKLWVLQTRAITAAGAPPCDEQTRLPPFVPPGPGVWNCDTTHFAKPMSKSGQCYAGTNGPLGPGGAFGKSAARAGVGIAGMDMRIVNGFAYTQVVPVMDAEELRGRSEIAKTFWSEKVYLKELKEFDDEWKPARIKEHEEIYALIKEHERVAETLETSTTTDKTLLELSEIAFAHIQKSYQDHHTYTVQAVMVVGDCMAQVIEWTGCSVLDAVELFDLASPASRGILHVEDPVVAEALAAIRANPRAVDALNDLDDEFFDGAELASDTLKFLKQSADDQLRAAMDKFIARFGYRLVHGYDVCGEVNVEVPELMLRGLLDGLNNDGSAERELQEKVERDIGAMRERVPEQHRADYDELLSDARQIYRMRDERGLFSDITGVGLARGLLLIVGRALAQRGALSMPHLLPFASQDEIAALITGDAERAVSSNELLRRVVLYERTSGANAPRSLGSGDPPPPPPEGLPAHDVRSLRGMMTGVGHLFTGQERCTSLGVVRGTCASRGVVQGTARVITEPAMFSSICNGDILVTHSTSAAFNSIVPMVTGIVTDFGGVLSHAAILARENAIPAVVGCMVAVEQIKTGMLVRVDGDNGEVTILQQPPQHEHADHHLLKSCSSLSS
eukprot:CAMPEP_0185847836 /NCGR_PEP_ID=MMETSP1354-20130828/2946_1 /TAXON_ID=708628 /ORGANISM="Erythrolobus madagascarensis, Strain CCMP3276" /LENGTH=980 /DNA_ID=CAMNT_0028548167 /DNA_START=295 /DNA_END=3237 /DNA_ORIENTATION=+